MLTKILEFHHSSQNKIYELKPTLYLPKDSYEDYLAFLFQNNEDVTTDNHIIYLEKAAFDAVLDNFHNEDLLILQEKEDMYMCYIMHSTFKNSGIVCQEQFVQNINEMTEYYQPSQDEKLFLQKIQNIVKGVLVHKISPFSYLQVCKGLFSQKLQLKLIDILKFMIGDSICYKMAPASIFGVCLKWTIDKYGIKNQTIHELIAHLIDLNNPETFEKIGELTQIMSQIMNMKSDQ